MELREYQREAVQAVEQAWVDGLQRPVLVMATGLGKTVILAELIRRAVRDCDRRPVVLVHRDELVRQTVDKLLAVDPALLIGVVQADRFEIAAQVDVVVASVATLRRRLDPDRRRYVSPDRFDLLVTDECHHGAAESYLAVYDHFGGRTPGSGTYMLGVTATLERGDGVPLGHLWQQVVAERATPWAIEAGHLVPVVARRALIDGLDLSGVRMRHGDFADGELGERMFRAGAPIATAVLEHGRRGDGTLRRGITFAPTIECAQQWAAQFNARGILSAVVIGATPHATRQAVYRAVGAGLLDMIVSVMCLTEGFDLPAVEMAVMGRPTRNRPLYVQMMGRALRRSEHTGKQNALILDICGTFRKPAISIADLDLPAACQCPDCDCDLRYRCTSHCDCLDEHLSACKHRCRTPTTGTGGVRPPVEQDHSAIHLEDFDPLHALRAALTPKGRTPWLMTTGGVPFLPAGRHTTTNTNTSTVFIWTDRDGTGGHRLGSYGDGRTRDHGSFEHFPHAVAAALELWGTKPPPLRGAATEAQVGLLSANGVAVAEGTTKQEASDAINVLFASRRLDG